MSDGREGVYPATAEEEQRKAVLYVALVGGIIALDALTKYVVTQTLVLYSPVPVFGDFVRLTYIYNPGAAFGLRLGPYSRHIFLVLTIVAVVMMLVWYRSTPWNDRLRLVAIATVTGGAIGNFIDRVRSPRGVIDFLDIGIGTTRWPVFNVADIAVTTGALLLAYSLWKEEKELERMKRREAEAREAGEEVPAREAEPLDLETDGSPAADPSSGLGYQERRNRP